MDITEGVKEEVFTKFSIKLNKSQTENLQNLVNATIEKSDEKSKKKVNPSLIIGRLLDKVSVKKLKND
jgi:hypothetical protein